MRIKLECIFMKLKNESELESGGINRRQGMSGCSLPNRASIGPRQLLGAIFLLLGFVFASAGAPIDGEHAALCAKRWLAINPNPMEQQAGKAGNVTTYFNAAGQARFHVVALDPTGFMVVAADDEQEPVIAFSTKGDFVGNASNPLFNILLRDMDSRFQRVQQDRQAKGAPATASVKAKAKWSTLSALSGAVGVSSSVSAVSDVCVAPFVQSEWNQATNDQGTMAVYNYYTPPFISPGNVKNDVCGCVATAWAQVMRYWKWPTTGVGTASFQISINGVSQSAALRGGDGLGGPYDWANMPLVPGALVNGTQCRAIGSLTYDAGVANNMSYTSSESGAWLQSSKIKNTFKYASAVDCKGSLAEDGTALRTNLDAKQPALLAIFEAAGPGHEVVVDGYGYNLGTLYHHINVGWGPSAYPYDSIWYNLPTIDTGGYDFTIITDCHYNIHPTITGEIISGRVTHPDGTPVSGVTVTLSGTMGLTGTTNARGIYAFTGIPSNSPWTVTPSGAGCAYFPSQALVQTGTSTEYGHVGNRTADFTATPGAHTVTPSAGPNGSISPNTPQVVSNGGSISFSATPNGGYAVDQWLVNGVLAQTGSTGFVLNNVTSDETVKVTFAVIPVPAQVQSPTPGSTLASSSMTLQWNAGTANTGYVLFVGYTAGGNDLYNSGDLASGVLSQDIIGIPTDGRQLYVRLWSNELSGWVYNDYSYTAALIYQLFTVTPTTDGNGVIHPGSPQTVLTGGSTTFTATPDSGYRVDEWLIDGVEAQTGTNTFTVSNVGMSHTVEVTFARLPSAAEIKFPVPGSILTGSTSLFQWNPGFDNTGYYLYVGSQQGAYDIFVSGARNKNVFSTTVTGLPMDGRMLYVRLWTSTSIGWLYKDYTYAAEGDLTQYFWSGLAGNPGVSGAADGSAAGALFSYPGGIAVDGSGNLYVGDAANNTIRIVSPTGVTTTLAGTPGITGTADGAGTDALFYNPRGVAVDGSGNVYVADANNNTIRKVTPAGVVSTLAGSPGLSGTSDGSGGTALFNGPRFLALDGSGNIYVSDYGNNTVRKVTPAGVVSTLAGSPGLSGSADGGGSDARFLGPGGVAVDRSGNVYVADSGNSTIRMITAAGLVTTLAGSPGLSGTNDGIGGEALFSGPEGLALDANANLYVTDNYNSVIRMVTPAGLVTTIGGTPGSPGDADGFAASARFCNPRAIASDGSGILYVADTSNHRIVKGTPASQQIGSLQLTITPPGAVVSGAQWQADDGAWQNSGAIVNGLTIGMHTVKFKAVTGYTSPLPMSVNISPNQTATMTATYVASPVPNGSQVVKLSSIWDLSGTYSGAIVDSDGNTIQLDFTLREDPNGNIAGDGTILYSSASTHWNGNMTMKGTVKSTGAIPVVALSISSNCAGTVVSGTNVHPATVSARMALNFGINGAGKTLVTTPGSLQQTITDTMTHKKASRFQKISSGQTISMPSEVTGDCTLTLNLSNTGTKATGSAKLETAPGQIVNLSVSGKYPGKTSPTSVALKGTGASLSLNISAAGANIVINSLNGKAFGQTLKWP